MSGSAQRLPTLGYPFWRHTILRASDLALVDAVAKILGEAPLLRGRPVRKIVCGFPLEEHKLSEDAWAVPGLELGRYLSWDPT